MKYLSARQISEQYDFCMKTARTLISEIQEQGDRYPSTAVIDGCGVRVSESVLIDFLQHRKALKDAIARNYVEPYRGENYEPGRTEPVEVCNR